MKKIAISDIPHILSLMSRKSEVVQLLKDNREFLSEIGVSQIGLFGSTVREEDTKDSDIDILVDFKPTAQKFRNFNLLCDLLDNTFGEKYDLVTTSGLSPYIGKKILKEVEYVSLTN